MPLPCRGFKRSIKRGSDASRAPTLNPIHACRRFISVTGFAKLAAAGNPTAVIKGQHYSLVPISAPFHSFISSRQYTFKEVTITFDSFSTSL